VMASPTVTETSWAWFSEEKGSWSTACTRLRKPSWSRWSSSGRPWPHRSTAWPGDDLDLAGLGQVEGQLVVTKNLDLGRVGELPRHRRDDLLGSRGLDVHA
jgi:hypothetical protein